jgi:cell fate regulator YaaT (PSP1 superfamily)
MVIVVMIDNDGRWRQVAIENEEDLEKLEDLEDDIAEESIIAETFDGPINAPVYHLFLEYSHDIFYAIYEGDPLAPGTFVIVPTRYGKDLAKVMGQIKDPATVSGAKITRIERPAGTADKQRASDNKLYEKDSFEICKEKIEEHNLQMKLVRVHYLLEEPKILFFFTADTRVDFRELVKDLVAIFKMRIELRQIGIRDEARISGGIGICGRSYCCHTIAEKLKPVSIKMAKDQNLSLNSMKISGSCGRLLCCLSYEHGFYAEQRKLYPPEGCRISWDDASWRVREINAILGLVTLDSEDGRKLMLPRKRFEKTETTWRIVNE